MDTHLKFSSSVTSQVEKEDFPSNLRKWTKALRASLMAIRVM